MKATVLVVLAIVLSVVLAGVAGAETGGTGTEPVKAAPVETKAKVEPKVSAKAGANPMVVFETNYGNIKVELFKDKAPLSVDNFLSYVKESYYDSTIVHRVVKNFVIQAGGMTADMHQKPQKAPIKNEATNGLKNLRGTLSMARTSDINSGSSHFFVNLKDNAFLDHAGDDPTKYGYAVFGQVVEGMDVVDKIAQVATGTKGQNQDVPIKPVMIVKAKLAGAPVAKTATTEKKTEAKQVGEPEGAKKPPETQPGGTSADTGTKTTK